jgi:predicted nucleotidyltransferase
MRPPKKEIARAAEILRSHGAKEVYLFGSAASGEYRKSSDVDFAIKGLPPTNFYRAVGDLLVSVSIPVDVVDLEQDTPFTRYLTTRGNLVRLA